MSPPLCALNMWSTGSSIVQDTGKPHSPPDAPPEAVEPHHHHHHHHQIPVPTQAPRAPAVRACLPCRQMKMKCEGGETPPCTRCRKAGRECTPQTQRLKAEPHGFVAYPQAAPVQYQRPLEAPTMISQPHGRSIPPPINNYPDHTNGYQPLIRPPNGYSNFHEPPNVSRLRAISIPPRHESSLELPSLISTTALDAVNGPPSQAQSPQPTMSDSLPFRKRKRTPVTNPNSDTLLIPRPSHDEQVLSNKDMRDMIALFLMRHRPFISCLRQEDFPEPGYMIEHELPLVYCICYVTSRYLHAGKDVRDMLFPEITRIQREVFDIKANGRQGDNLSHLKALIVLYAFADLTPPSSDSTGKNDLLYWPLKSLLESYALRLGLHRSVQDFKAEIKARPAVESVLKSIAYKRYTYWLWLYNLSYYCSILSGTPPSIRIDATIRAAPAIIDDLGCHLEIATLFPEIELSLIWEQSSLRNYSLGEWWCLPDQPIDETRIDAMLKETDGLMDAWYQKWWPYISRDEGGALIDYYGRYTRFQITSYAMKLSRISPHSQSPIQKAQINQCVRSANHVLEWPLSRGPIQKDMLRYVPDSACIIIAFCCLFILSAVKTYGTEIESIQLSESLENIEEAANMMIRLALDDEHKPRVQGQLILRRVEALKAYLENNHHHHPHHQTPHQHQPPHLNQHRIDNPNGNVDAARRESFEDSHTTGSTAPGQTPMMLNATPLAHQEFTFDMPLGMSHEGFEETFFGMENFWDFSMLLPGAPT